MKYRKTIYDRIPHLNQRLHAWTRFYAEREFLGTEKWADKKRWLSESKQEIERLADLKFKDERELEGALGLIWTNYLSRVPAKAPFCRVCGRNISPLDKSTIWHHISYSPENTVPVHAECHHQIHSGEVPELAPVGGRKIKNR